MLLDSGLRGLKFVGLIEDIHIALGKDVDIFDINDVMWAMTTRFQGDVDVITIPGVRTHPLDPSNDPDYSSSIYDHGIACKTIFDGTVPYHLKDCFKRADFMDVDLSKWQVEKY